MNVESEPAPASLEKSDVRTLQFHSLAEKDEPTFKVVFNLGEAEPGIHPQFAIGELGAALFAVLPEQAPENPTGYVSNQILAIHEDTIVDVKEAEPPGLGRCERKRCSRTRSGKRSPSSCDTTVLLTVADIRY